MRKDTPLGTGSWEKSAFSSDPKRCVAKPKLHDCLWKTHTRSSLMMSLFVSEEKGGVSLGRDGGSGIFSCTHSLIFYIDMHNHTHVHTHTLKYINKNAVFSGQAICDITIVQD